MYIGLVTEIRDGLAVVPANGKKFYRPEECGELKPGKSGRLRKGQLVQYDLNADTKFPENVTIIDQAFGTDLGSDKSPKERKAIIMAALETGYRLFDCATLYQTFDTVSDCLKEKNLVQQALILYKVKLTESINNQLEDAKTKLGRGPDIVMLHELAGEQADTKKAINSLASHVAAKKARYLGLSNVTSAEELNELCQHAKSKCVPITFLQNRFNPYCQDTKVRDYCHQHGIIYMAYGLMGSQQSGACVGEGYGLPTAYLHATLDSRLTKRAASLLKGAQAHGNSPPVGEMLLCWAMSQGVVPVSFSTQETRIRSNHNAHKLYNEQSISQMEEMFKTPEPKKGSGPLMAKNINHLYNALLDPTAWWILDQLTLNAKQLLNTVMDVIGVDDKDKLSNISYNLIRFAADLQPHCKDQWLLSFNGTLESIQKKFVAKPTNDEQRSVHELCLEWLMKNSMEGLYMMQALDVGKDICNGHYKPRYPVTQTGRRNAGLPTQAFEKPAVDKILTLKRSDNYKFYDHVTYAEVNFDQLQQLELNRLPETPKNIYYINYGDASIQINFIVHRGDEIDVKVVSL